MGTETTHLAEEIAALKDPIEHWRTHRTKLEPMPPALWEKAARLALIHGIQPVAKALNLNYGKLKSVSSGVPYSSSPRRSPRSSNIHPTRDRSRNHLNPPGFVELEPPAPVGPFMGKDQGLDLAVELIRTDGCQLKIQTYGGASLDIKTLVGTFLGAP